MILLFLLPLIHSTCSLSCYQCRRENQGDAAIPKYYLDHNIEPLDTSCLEEAKPCEDQDDEQGMVNCTSITLGPDHAFGNMTASVDVFLCMYLRDNSSEGEVEVEVCAHEGVGGEVVGSDCNLTANCGEDGCNYAAPILQATPLPHACSTCELPVSDFCHSTDHIDIIQSECELVNCSSGVNQCFISFDQDSCSVNLGCKTPELTDCQSETCSVCEAEETECVLDTSLFCEPGRGCVEEPPHACLTCVHPVCEDTDISGSCDYENCTDGVRECYAQLDSCTITRGCKPLDLTCEDESTTCSICGDEECSLNTEESSCSSGGECGEPVVCNSCAIDLTTIDYCDSDADLMKEIKDNCDKEVTCKTGVQNCAVIMDGCKATIGCNEKQSEEDEKQLVFVHVSYQELVDNMTKSCKEGIFNDCSDPVNTTSALSDGPESRSSSALAMTSFNFIICMIYFTECVW